MDSSGNVGIGTTSPGSLLQVGVGTSNSPSVIASLGGSANNIMSALSLVNTLGNAVAGQGVALDFHVNAAYSPTGRIATIAESTGTPAALAFYTYNNGLNEKMRIDSAGNVGVGTTSPGSKLTISGGNNTDSEIRLINTGPATDNDWFITPNYNDQSLRFRTNGAATTVLTMLDSGNVGIGTTSPAQKLDVNGNLAISGTTFVDSTRRNIYLNSFASGGANGIFFRDGFTYNASITVEDHNGSSADGICISGFDGVSFSTGANTKNERMRIDSSGNVGIGTTSPGYKLTVDSDTSYGGMLIKGNNAPGLSLLDHSSTSESKIYLQSTASSSGNLRISADNNNTATTPSIEFRIGNSEKVRISDAGNVGIGTTSPNQKLSIETNALSSNPEYIEFTDAGSGSSWADGQDYGGMQWFMGDGTGIGAHTVAQIKAQNTHVGAAGNAALVFSTAPYNTVMSERMRITGGGAVLIGTTSTGFVNDNGWTKEGANVVQRHANTEVNGSVYTYFIYNSSLIGSIFTKRNYRHFL